MDKRTYLISVFEDTLARIRYSAELTRAEKQSVAAQHQAEVLILGAFGCGAFRNDPIVVAQAYKNILPEFIHHFQTIEFAVYCPPHDDSNYRAFKSILT